MIKRLLFVCIAALAFAGCSKDFNVDVTQEEAIELTAAWWNKDDSQLPAWVSTDVVRKGTVVARESLSEKVLLKAKQKCWVVIVDPDSFKNCICDTIYLLVDASSGAVSEYTFENAYTVYTEIATETIYPFLDGTVSL